MGQLTAKGKAMPTYRIYEIQEEVTTRKLLHMVEADSEDDAIELAMNGETVPEEQELIGAPHYVISGWSVKPDNAANEERAWKEALTDLETRRHGV